MDRRSLLTAMALAPLLSSPAFAQGKPITIVVPFGPGGSGDISARMFGEFLTKKANRSVIVENKPGANGIVGVEAAKVGATDGSLLMLATTSTHLANPATYKKLPYDPGKDFRLVGSFGPGSTYVLVRPDAPWKTLKDFVTAAKATPGKFTYGHFNATSNVSAALFAHMAGIELTPVPYKQVNQAMIELIAGQTDIVFTDTVAGDSFVASGQLRALAVHADAPLKAYPSIPLVTTDYPQYTIRGGFLGIAVPAATPVQVQQQINDWMNEAVTTNPMKSRLEGFAFAPTKMTLEDLRKFEQEERAKWKEYVTIAKLPIQ